MPAESRPAKDLVGETIVIDETGHGPFQVKVRSGTSTFIVDEPIGVGGMGSGPNPYDLLSAAIGSCSLMTVRLYAERKKWPLERIRVKVTHRRLALSARDAFVRELEFVGPLDGEQRAKLLEISMRCPVHLTMERGSDITTILVDKPPLDDSATTKCEHARDISQVCDDFAGG